MGEPSETIVEEREELMVSPTGGNPTLRIAHFLKPSVTIIDEPLPEFPSFSLFSLPPTFEPAEWPLKVTFHGWRCQSAKWISWVNYLRSKYESVWKKAGIYEAIMSSTYEIRRNEDLLFGVAEKWCPKTNTFIFPWGEVTITLEEMIVLGGYSVLGSPVFCPVESRELKEIEEKLLAASKEEAQRNKAGKVTQKYWLRKFIWSGSEIEHEAFLVLWLSKFVFPNSFFIRKCVFPIAVHLARGTPIALAPAVLAGIYRDLSLLKETIVALTPLIANALNHNVLKLTLWMPFQLVQLWAWERFPEFQPKPNLLNYGEPRLARWQRVKGEEVKNVRYTLDSAGESFNWRPYATVVNNWHFHKFYMVKEEWVLVESGLDEVLQSFARCLRVSELVGLGCIEQYHPHRVAMQFGMDQDLPGLVTRCNGGPEIAWNNYNRPINNSKLYIPSRLFLSDVTTRYLERWRQSVLSQQDAIKGVVRRRRSLRRFKLVPQILKGNSAGADGAVPPGFPPKRIMVKAWDSVEEVKPTAVELLRSCRKHDDLLLIKKKKHDNLMDRPADDGKCLLGQCHNGDNHSTVPPGFPPKYNTVKAGDSTGEVKQTVLQILRSGGKHDSVGNRPTGDGNHSSSQSQGFSCSIADNGAVRNMDSFPKSVRKIMLSDVAMGRAETAMDDANESRAGSLVQNKVSIKEENYTFEKPILELEARISRLERVVAELKEARVGYMFDTKPTKEGWSGSYGQ